MTSQPDSPYLVLRKDGIEPVDRGNGVGTLPYVGHWNSVTAGMTSGVTVFGPGTSVPLHSHNVEEIILVLQGRASAVIDGERYDLHVGDSTWVPAGVDHHFFNHGDTQMRIYWVYGGREVTRTICATGETVPHLSPRDRNDQRG